MRYLILSLRKASSNARDCALVRYKMAKSVLRSPLFTFSSKIAVEIKRPSSLSDAALTTSIMGPSSLAVKTLFFNCVLLRAMTELAAFTMVCVER